MGGDRCQLLCLDLPKAEAIRQSVPSLTSLEADAERAKALGDPTRLLIATALRTGDELCVCDLAWICDRSEKLVSHHLRTLRAAALVHSRRDGKMVMYSLTATGGQLLDAVAQASGSAA